MRYIGPSPKALYQMGDKVMARQSAIDAGLCRLLTHAVVYMGEIDGHENAGHVSGVLIGLHGIDLDLAVLPSNRLLLRFQECSRSKSKLKTIRLYSDDHCVFHTWICLSIILQLQEVYTTYCAAVTCILPLF